MVYKEYDYSVIHYTYCILILKCVLSLIYYTHNKILKQFSGFYLHIFPVGANWNNHRN